MPLDDSLNDSELKSRQVDLSFSDLKSGNMMASVEEQKIEEEYKDGDSVHDDDSSSCESSDAEITDLVDRKFNDTPLKRKVGVETETLKKK